MAYNLFVAFHAARDASRAHKVLEKWQKIDEIETCEIGTPGRWGKGPGRGGNEFEDLLTSEFGRTNFVVVLIGYQTAKQPWILQTLKKGFQLRKGMFGIYIHKLPGPEGQRDYKGRNPFDFLYSNRQGSKTYLSTFCPTYDWVLDDGANNISRWVRRSRYATGLNRSPSGLSRQSFKYRMLGQDQH